MAQTRNTSMTIKLAILSTMMFGLSTPALALASDPACARKIADIEVQIEHAKASGNDNRVKSLGRALSAARDHCTDARLIDEKQEEIDEKREDIEDILEDLHEQEEEGDIDKVKRLERKLAHEREELEILTQELAEIKDLSRAGTK